MSDFALDQGVIQSDNGGKDASDTGGTLVTSGGSNTYGSWIELIASTSKTSNALRLAVLATSGTNNYTLRIGVGSAGNEEIISNDIIFYNKVGSSGQIKAFPLPLQIAEGTRVSVALAANAATQTADVTIDLFAGSLISDEGFQQSITYGVTTPAGTSIDPGGTINTKGSWAEITSSTVGNTKGFLLCLQPDDNNDLADASYFFDVGIGGAGSEEIILNDFWVNTGAFETVQPTSFFVKVSIPDGTRIAARSQSSINDATDRLMNVGIIGLS